MDLKSFVERAAEPSEGCLEDNKMWAAAEMTPSQFPATPNLTCVTCYSAGLFNSTLPSGLGAFTESNQFLFSFDLLTAPFWDQ